MRHARIARPSLADVAYAVDMALACLVTYAVMAVVLPRWVGWSSTPVGVLWAVISTVFVYKDTRAHSVTAGLSRLIATLASFALCLIYLSLLPPTAVGMAALIALAALVMIVIGRRDEMGLTAITIAVIMIVAADSSQEAWRQPLLRLVDTIVGIAVGVACKWVFSFLFYRIVEEEAR